MKSRMSFCSALASVSSCPPLCRNLFCRNFGLIRLVKQVMACPRDFTVQLTEGRLPILPKQHRAKKKGFRIVGNRCSQMSFASSFSSLAERPSQLAGHCFTIRSHCNFFRNARFHQAESNNKRKQTKQQPRAGPEWKLSSLFLYNVQLKWRETARNLTHSISPHFLYQDFYLSTRPMEKPMCLDCSTLMQSTQIAFFPMHQESEMVSRKSSGSAKPLFAQVPLYHSRCTSSSAHKQTTPQGFSQGSLFGREFSSLEWRKHGKHVPCGRSCIGLYTGGLSSEHPASCRQSYPTMSDLFIDLANAVAERDRYPFQRECIT